MLSLNLNPGGIGAHTGTRIDSNSGARPSYRKVGGHRASVARYTLACSSLEDDTSSPSSAKTSSPFQPSQKSDSPSPFSVPKTGQASPFDRRESSSRRSTPPSTLSQKPKRDGTIQTADVPKSSVALEDTPLFVVIEALRRQDHRFDVSDELKGYARYCSLESIFPGTGLADLFHASSEFRQAIRRATREDLFRPNPKWSEESNRRIVDPRSTLMVSWLTSEERERVPSFPVLDQVMEKYGIQISGAEFFHGISGLCSGDKVSGSLTDIVSLQGRARVRHSWHQDSGLLSPTVLVGFPREDHFEGEGVFSHVCKLSHALKPITGEGEVIEWEQYTPEPEPIPEKYIIRPVFKRGQEIVVYNDAFHLHSAPDYQNREAVWRLM